jgi:hypothetical protein
MIVGQEDADHYCSNREAPPAPGFGQYLSRWFAVDRVSIIVLQRKIDQWNL